ncbi:MAG: hypothetical protein LBN09_02200 [Clostridioides sp.]|jgi:hypothetical protein|nr:hypothetical protein [Clostridioides sp.]
MKKINKNDLDSFAKDKNIDKDKVEKIADSYVGKSEDELIEELVKVGSGLEGKEEIVNKFKVLLNEKQQRKLETVMNKIATAESQSRKKNKRRPIKKANHR